MTKRLEGLVAAAYTPMNQDGSLRLSTVPRMVDSFVDNGVSGIYVCGSTGEGPSLTGDERMQVAEAFVAASAGRLPVIVQVGHNSVAESRALAAHASEIGADMVSASPPAYFKPIGLEPLLLSMAEVASGAPSLPFYYYHIPSFTGVMVDMVEFLEVGRRRIPNLAGIKFSDFNVFEFQSCLQSCGAEFDALWGCDEMLLSALVVGAKGAVGSTYNVVSPLFLRIMRLFEEGNLEEAERLQYLAVRFVRVLERYAPLHTSLKAVMKMIGLDCGGVRLPQQPLPDGTVEQIAKDLEDLGLMKWFATAS